MQNNIKWSKAEIREGLNDIFKNAKMVAEGDKPKKGDEVQQTIDALAYLRELKREVFQRLDIARAPRARRSRRASAELHAVN